MDLKLQKIIPQLITVLVVVLVFGFFTYNAQINMENRGIDFGYGFLSQESSFDVQFSMNSIAFSLAPPCNGPLREPIAATTQE